MEVLYIFNSLKYSGAEIMYVDAAKLFREKGCKLTVIATAEDLGEFAPFFEKAGYKVLHMPYPKLKNYLSRIRFYGKFCRFLKKSEFDVVHIHSSPTMWGMALCAWLTGKRSVYTFHNVFPTRFISYPYHCLLRYTAKYIFKCRFHTISDSVYENECKRFHNASTKIYNWYGSDRYYPADKIEKERERSLLGIRKESLILISIGGCTDIKRHSDIIKALPYILKKIPGCIYLHLGKGVSEREEMELALQLGVENSIKFCGNQADVRKYLIVSDIYLMPSRFEGMPITTIEAMACQIPAILYDVPGLRDFNKEGDNSFLIPGDHLLLAEKIVYLHSNKNIANESAMRANIYVNRYFNMETNVEKIFKLYNSPVIY